MADEVWVVVDHSGPDISDVTLEILGEARELAEQWRAEVCAVAIGHQTYSMAEILATYGANKVYLIQHELLLNYTTDAYVQVLLAITRQYQPAIVLFGATANGSDLALSLATKIKVPVATDCVRMEIAEGGSVRATKPTYNDQAYMILAFDGEKPYVATMRPGVIGLDQPVASRSAEVIEVEPQIDADALRMKLRRRFKPDPSTLSLVEAEIVVGGGAGVGTKENWALVTDFANELGASVGGSRVAADLGLIPSEKVIGQSGVTIAPTLYVAVGISGATHHTQGVKDAKTVIAINKDSAAPVFNIADLKVISDLRLLFPVLIAEIHKSKST